MSGMPSSDSCLPEDHRRGAISRPEQQPPAEVSPIVTSRPVCPAVEPPEGLEGAELLEWAKRSLLKRRLMGSGN